MHIDACSHPTGLHTRRFGANAATIPASAVTQEARRDQRTSYSARPKRNFNIGNNGACVDAQHFLIVHVRPIWIRTRFDFEITYTPVNGKELWCIQQGQSSAMGATYDACSDMMGRGDDMHGVKLLDEQLMGCR